MSDVQDLMFTRFLTLYGEPKTDNLEAFFEEYERVLKGTAKDILQLAADRVIKEQQFRSWPTPGECVKAVNAEAERKAIERERFSPKQLDEQERHWPKPTAESKARVRAILEEFKRGAVVTGPAPGGTLTEKSKRMSGEGG